MSKTAFDITVCAIVLQ